MLLHCYRSVTKRDLTLAKSVFDIIDRCSAVFIDDQENCINSGVSHLTSMVPVKGVVLSNFVF